MATRMSRTVYAEMSGPTIGDRVRLADTDLIIEVERSSRTSPSSSVRAQDASIDLAAIAQMQQKFPKLDLVLIESDGDTLAATFSPELAVLTIYVIDVAAGDKIPSKGGPGITRSDLLVINCPLHRREGRSSGGEVILARSRRAAIGYSI